MAVPKVFEFFEGFLNSLKDGKIHTAKEVRESIAKEMNISDEDKLEMLPSGNQSRFDNRVNCASA
ncbi:MAG: winged helix-turn-helix domain-containing protein [Eubacterium sp.]|nr:winged helix-turn-helix domain-containing protein [Eubacterium sp.]